MTDENKEIAKVNWRVYMNYFFYSKTSSLLFVITFLLLLAKRGFQVFFDYALLRWVKSIADTQHNDSELFLLLVAATIGTTLITFIGALFNISFALSISINIFRKMLKKVWNAPINLYFDITPTGVILNRFSKDIQMLDIIIPFSIRSQLGNYVVLLSVVVITAYNVIWVLLVIPFILVIMIYFMKRFSRTLKESSRMENVTASPVLTHIGEILNGVSTVRAYDKWENFEKSLHQLLDNKMSVLVIKRGVQSWFNTRINLLSVFLMSFAYLYWVSTHFWWIIDFHEKFLQCSLNWNHACISSWYPKDFDDLV